MKKIAVKELAYFTNSSGDLTIEFFSNHDLKVGTEAHRYLQRQYNSKSEKEVYIKHEISSNNKDYLLHGYIDGILNIDDEIIIEEIKSTTYDLDLITLDYHKEHLAQLLIYGYLYCLENEYQNIHLRLTYISVVDYNVKSFDMIKSIDELEEFTLDSFNKYIDWLDLMDIAKEKKNISINEIKFPFENERPGQRALMEATYKTLKSEDILYSIAPTGIGKTMATIFAGLKTLDEKDKLFYLTAKGSAKNAPLEAIKILQNKGLKLKVIDINAKKKMCNHGQNNCNPDDCPFSKGYFDRLNLATEEIYRNYDVFDYDLIKKISDKHQICGFEFSLYLSYFCDMIIADYNYLFDPRCQLIRYFDDDTYKTKILVDEAHNLISRSRDMYSANISEIDIRIIRKTLNGYKPNVRNDCNKAIELLNSYREFLNEQTVYVDLNMNSDLNVILRQINQKCEAVFEENKKIKDKDKVMDSYFKIMDLLRISEIFGPKHRVIVKLINDEIYINYYCLDAKEYLLDTIKTSINGIEFFSATMYPINYYSNLITASEGKFLELKSPYNPNNLDIIINNKISTKYKNRENTIDDIIETIEIVTNTKKGNYIVFFPSYQYMNMVIELIDEPNYEMIIQRNNLTDLEKNEIINKFKTTTNNKVGFFVMGGVFSEGIDLQGDSLNGVIVVGVGLPMICDENNILKDYYESEYEKGFEYAYTYPGFNKVIQAVGRVIRSENDKGIAILMDERFSYSEYLKLMPPHWKNKKIINNSYDLKRELINFYKDE